jgi:Tfp pilus assembly protein PilV
MGRGRVVEIRRRGSTLIEVFLAATIVAVGFIGVAGALSYAAKVSRVARDMSAAEQVAADLLAQARLANTGDLATWYTYPGDTSTNAMEQACSAELGDSGLAKSEAWFTVTDVSSSLKGVSVVVSWGTGSSKGRVETQTLISPRF